MPSPQPGLSPTRLSQLLLALSLGSLTMSLNWAWRGNEEAMTMAIALSVFSAGLRLLAQRGYSQLASAAIAILLNVVTIAGVTYFGGPRAHAPAFLLVVVMATALFLGWRGGVASLMACAAYLAIDGMWGPPAWATGVVAHTPGTITIDWLLALTMSGSLGIVAFHTASQQVAQAVRSEEAKQVALIEVEASSRAKSVFLANMSHELRTPLTAILGYSELLEEELPEDDGDDLRKITHAGRHLLALIDDVLDMSRVESGKLDFNVQQVDLDSLVRDVVALVQPAASRANSTMLVTTTTLGTLCGDRLRIQQILQNLLSNAIKYAPGQIHLSASRDSENVVLRVRDHGAGIPANVLPTLFQPFTRGHGSEKQGTGLGLALAATLAERMGGRLTVASTARGAEFTLSLPTDWDGPASKMVGAV